MQEMSKLNQIIERIAIEPGQIQRSGFGIRNEQYQSGGKQKARDVKAGIGISGNFPIRTHFEAANPRDSKIYKNINDVLMEEIGVSIFLKVFDCQEILHENMFKSVQYLSEGKILYMFIILEDKKKLPFKGKTIRCQLLFKDKFGNELLSEEFDVQSGGRKIGNGSTDIENDEDIASDILYLSALKTENLFVKSYLQQKEFLFEEKKQAFDKLVSKKIEEFQNTRGFCPTVTYDRANEILTVEPPGSYLFRYNPKNPTSIVLSFNLIYLDTPKKIFHMPIMIEERGYSYKTQETIEDPLKSFSLIEIVNEFGLENPVSTE